MPIDEIGNWSDDQNFILQVFSHKFKKHFTKDPNNNILLAFNIPLKDIYNLIEDIISLAKNVDSIRFVFYKRIDNELGNRIAKETMHACNLISYN